MRHRCLVALTASALVVAACSDSSGPSVPGSPFLSATVDGTAWSPDTALAFLHGAGGDTTLVIVAGRIVSISRSDRFSPESATIPESVSRRNVSGLFRLRYRFQQVCTPVDLSIPWRRDGRGVKSTDPAL